MFLHFIKKKKKITEEKEESFSDHCYGLILPVIDSHLWNAEREELLNGKSDSRYAKTIHKPVLWLQSHCVLKPSLLHCIEIEQEKKKQGKGC